jgi:hypothetical protein
LNGRLALSSQGGYVNSNLTIALRRIDQAWIGWPTRQTDMGTSPAALALRGAPAQPAYALNGTLARSYMDDYYYRVHLRPDRLDLGQLSTAQTRSIEVWNAYIDRTLTLNQVLATAADGIVVTAPGGFPLAFAPNQSRIWTVQIVVSGPGKIDATLQWLFADPSEDVQLEITGNRLTAWTVLPDWSNGISETLVWLTDIGEAVDGSQARTPLRGDPRRRWEAAYIAYGTDRQLAESLLYGAAARNYVVPVWWDGDVLAVQLSAGAPSIPLVTAGRDYAVGAQVLLWGSPTDYELVEVASVAANAITLANPTVNIWPAGTRVWPCRNAALTDTPRLTRKNDRLIEAQIRFEAREPCDWPAIAPATMYAGYPVLEQHPNEADDLTAQYARKLVTLDNQIALPDVDDFSGFAWPTQSHAWTLSGRDAQSAHRSLLYWLQGQAQALWVPSWQDDVTLTGPVAGNATTLNVAWAGIARYLTLMPGRRHLRIELDDGSVFYRAVTAAAEVGQTSENLAIDSALGVAIDPQSVRAISWMALCTLAGDSVEILHVTDGDGIATCTASFAGVPQEEP